MPSVKAEYDLEKLMLNMILQWHIPLQVKSGVPITACTSREKNTLLR